MTDEKTAESDIVEPPADYENAETSEKPKDIVSSKVEPEPVLPPSGATTDQPKVFVVDKAETPSPSSQVVEVEAKQGTVPNKEVEGVAKQEVDESLADEGLGGSVEQSPDLGQVCVPWQRALQFGVAWFTHLPALTFCFCVYLILLMPDFPESMLCQNPIPENTGCDCEAPVCFQLFSTL